MCNKVKNNKMRYACTFEKFPMFIIRRAAMDNLIHVFWQTYVYILVVCIPRNRIYGS